MVVMVSNEMNENEEVGTSLIKQLASCNKSTRDKALNILLKSWLPNQTEISEEDMKKLWKGLFYCMWHADKLPAQTELADRLSSLLPSLDLPLAVHYFSVFLLTMRREWTGIDALRLDKFYLLIRRFLHCFFEVLKKNSWDVELTRRFMLVLEEKSLLADDKFLGNGVNYHIVSIFVEELMPFLPVSKEVLEEGFGMLISVMGRSQDKLLVGKIKSNVFQELLKMGKRLLETKKSGSEVDARDEMVLLGTIALLMGFSTKFFDIGSSGDCRQGNRKILFSLHEEFRKLEKNLGSSGIDIEFPDVNVDDEEEEEVPNLVPVMTEMEMGASHNKVLKRCKKANKEYSESEEKEKSSGKKKKKNKKKSDSASGTENNIPTDMDDEIIVSADAADINLIPLNESVISNLQMQFEKVAAEVGMDNNTESVTDLAQVAVNGAVTRKRKRAKSSKGKLSQNGELNGQVDAEGCPSAKTGEKSAKKVKFSMKNNLVWKPQSPLPPQSLRIPPSVTPRGSALKKGVPPGPVQDMAVAVMKVKKRAKPVKKGMKAIKVAKTVKKLKSLSS